MNGLQYSSSEQREINGITAQFITGGNNTPLRVKDRVTVAFECLTERLSVGLFALDRRACPGKREPIAGLHLELI